MPQLKKQNLSASTQALVLFGAISLSFISLSLYLSSVTPSVAKARMDFASEQLSRRFEQLVRSHVAVAEALAKRFHQQQAIPVEDNFDQMADAIVGTFPGFYAINWADHNGVIRFVYPKEINAAAKDQDLTQRTDVNTYLQLARQSGTTTLTPLVSLYQGPKGFVSYTPVKIAGQHAGWVNSVFALEPLMREVFLGADFGSADVELLTADGSKSLFHYTPSGDGVGDITAESMVEVFNQKFLLRLNYGPAALEDWHLGISLLALLFGLVLAAVTSLLFYRITLARVILKDALANEKRDNILLNLMSHDFANTTTLIAGNAGRAIKEPEKAAKYLAKVATGCERQMSLIRRVRELRSVELGRQTIKFQRVPLPGMLEKAVADFGEQAKAKSVILEMAAVEANAVIEVDPVIFESMVLQNAISNAIKFTPHGGKVSLSARVSKKKWRYRF